MIDRFKVFPLTLIVLSAFTTQQSCAASTSAFATDASNSIIPFLAVGELSLFAGGTNGKGEAVQGAKALIATGLATELLKYTVREKRPNGDSLDSFPSGHSSAAFAMATALADMKPQYKWEAYGLATTIAWSRIEVGAHHWQDVVAGAALGHFITKQFTSDHIMISPAGLAYKWGW